MSVNVTASDIVKLEVALRRYTERFKTSDFIFNTFFVTILEVILL